MADRPEPTSSPGTDESAPPRHEFTRGLYGWITHTDLASRDPAATKAWCAAVLGWRFTMDFPAPGGGQVHLFAYSEQGGGAVRPVNPPEVPGSIPYVHVEDAHAAFDKAIVRAPGGVPIGFSGP